MTNGDTARRAARAPWAGPGLAIALASAAWFACTVRPDDPRGRGCDQTHGCLEGEVCLQGYCTDLAATVDDGGTDAGTPSDAGTDAGETDAGNPVTRWNPPKQLTWFWQLQGTVDLGKNAAAYDIDGFDTSASTVTALHAASRRVICYFSAGSSENFRPDFTDFSPSVQGNGNGFPGEKWLDIRSSTLRPIMQARIQMCKDKGFDAVEPDNVDGYANDTGFPLTAQDQLTYNLWLADTAHGLGLAVFLKNDLGQLAALEPFFDGALNEQCAQYAECAGYSVFLDANKPVLQAEYGAGTAFCAAANSAGRMGALFNVDLDGTTYTPCW